MESKTEPSTSDTAYTERRYYKDISYCTNSLGETKMDHIHSSEGLDGMCELDYNWVNNAEFIFKTS